MKLSEKTGNRRALIYDYLNLAMFYHTLAYHEKVLEWGHKGLKLAEEVGASSITTVALQIVISGYLETGKPDSAALLIGRLEREYNQHPNHNDWSSLYYIKGLYNNKVKNYQLALQHLLKSRQLFNNGNPGVLSSIYQEIGSAFLHTGHYQQSEIYLDSALTLAKQINNQTLITSTYKTLNELHKSAGRYDKAYESQAMYVKHIDTLKGREHALLLYELQEKYDTRERNRKIESLNEQNRYETDRRQRTVLYSAVVISCIVLISILIYYAIRKRNRYKLLQSEHKRLLAQMNPHFIANSMTAIRAFLHENPEAAAEFTARYNLLMRDILDYSGKETIRLEEELDLLRNYIELEQLRFPFTYSIEVDPGIDPEYERVPPLLLQPVVENAIRHGLEPKQGDERSLSIRIQKQQGEMQYSVRDNGVGMQQHRTGDASNHRTSRVHSTGILQARLASLKKGKSGKIISRPLDPGTEVLLSFPVS